VKQISKCRSAEAEATKFRTMYHRADEGRKLLWKLKTLSDSTREETGNKLDQLERELKIMSEQKLQMEHEIGFLRESVRTNKIHSLQVFLKQFLSYLYLLTHWAFVELILKGASVPRRKYENPIGKPST